MNNNIIYYSINTKLAHYINQRFYNDIHYVWVSPFYSDNNRNPPSSNPKDIYSRLKQETSGIILDNHSFMIENNKLGIIKGATERKNQGIISEKKEKIIHSIIQKSNNPALFYPLIYIIPTCLVQSLISKPNFEMKAYLFSEEYIITDLNGSNFDIITP